MTEREGRLEVTENDGLRGEWLHDSNHGPWQTTAPHWATREFAWVKKMVRESGWWPPYPSGDLGEGHVVHLVGLYDNGELVDGPRDNVYYEATVKWSDGTVAPLLLWNNTGQKS